MSQNYKWSEIIYRDISMIFFSFTNFHIIFHPLLADNNLPHSQYRNQIEAICNQQSAKRRRVHERCRERQVHGDIEFLN